LAHQFVIPERPQVEPGTQRQTHGALSPHGFRDLRYAKPRNDDVRFERNAL
jgi:hypothetical protein